MLKRAARPRARAALALSAWLTGTLSACGEHTPSGDADHSAAADQNTSAAGTHSADPKAGSASSNQTGTFRISTLTLRDPHLFLGGADLTDNSPLGISVNKDLIQGGLDTDYDNDGYIDVSIIIQQQDQKLRLVDARCPPSDQSRCTQHPNPGLDVSWTLSSECLSLPTKSNYQPAVQLPDSDCLTTTEARDVSMTLGGVPIEMTSAKMTMRHSEPNLEGLLEGFVTQQKAEQALLPSYVPLLAGSPLSNYLHDTDRDTAQSPNGEDGYWFYVNFVAEPASYTEP